MSRVQPIKFHNVEDLLSSLPKLEKQIVLKIRNIILDTLPNVQEKLSHNVPFYYLRKRVCFIWPASVPWGNIESGVALGFCQGDQLQDGLNQLTFEERKKVGRKIYNTLHEVDTDIIKCYLTESAAIDKR